MEYNSCGLRKLLTAVAIIYSSLFITSLQRLLNCIYDIHLYIKFYFVNIVVALDRHPALFGSLASSTLAPTGLVSNKKLYLFYNEFDSFPLSSEYHYSFVL